MTTEATEKNDDVTSAPLADAEAVRAPESVTKETTRPSTPDVPTPKLTPEQQLAEGFEKLRRASEASSADEQETVTRDAGDKKPATQQAVKDAPPEKTDAATTEKREDEELPEELPSDNAKANAAWKRHRQKMRELEDQLKAQKDAKQQPTTPSARDEKPVPAWAQEAATPPPVKDQPKPAPDKFATSWLVEVMARHAAGEEGTAAAAEAAREQLQAQATPHELVEILTQARRGGFGERSEDIAALCREWLPVVQATAEERRQQEAVQAEAGRRHEQSWVQARQVLPGLSDAASQDAKDFLAASKALSETFGIGGDFFRALPNAPAIVANYLTLTRASAAKTQLETQLATVRAENLQLRKRLGIADSPQRGGAPPSDAPRKLSAEDQLRAGFRAAGVEV